MADTTANLILPPLKMIDNLDGTWSVAVRLAGQYIPLPVLTTVQMNAIPAPAMGMLIFNSTVLRVAVYTGAAWVFLTIGDHTHQTTGIQGGQIDHGLGLTAASLLDDDHAQYLLASGARALAGDISLAGYQLTNGFEALGGILQNNFLFIPTLGVGWTAAVTGSGGTGSLSLMRLYAYTGATDPSTARLYTFVQGLDRASANTIAVDWTKKLWIIADLCLGAVGATASWWFQLKGVNTLGNLAAKGLGVVGSVADIYSESYGAARGSTTLAATMTANYIYRVGILLDPSVPNIKYYVNGVLKFTETTVNNIPYTGSTNDSYLLLGIQNTGTAANASIFAANIILWQEQGS